jgi:hypothetical protein
VAEKRNPVTRIGTTTTLANSSSNIISLMMAKTKRNIVRMANAIVIVLTLLCIDIYAF